MHCSLSRSSRCHRRTGKQSAVPNCTKPRCSSATGWRSPGESHRSPVRSSSCGKQSLPPGGGNRSQKRLGARVQAQISGGPMLAIASNPRCPRRGPAFQTKKTATVTFTLSNPCAKWYVYFTNQLMPGPCAAIFAPPCARVLQGSAPAHVPDRQQGEKMPGHLAYGQPASHIGHNTSPARDRTLAVALAPAALQLVVLEPADNTPSNR